MSATRTGGFAIGFRRGGGWQGDLEALIRWAKQNEFSAIDLGRDADKTGAVVQQAGLRLGSVDLAEWQPMISPDKGKRRAAVARNSEYIRACAALGPLNYFFVMLPENPALPRKENFGYMVESFSELAPVMESCGARLAIEGWPGPGALCCTPEGYRAFFAQCPSKAMGINYDPSHLIRMGIDPIRYISEFASRVCHVHGKDTELLPERLYEYGNLQPATFAAPFFCGEQCWRYTIPGHGQMRWTEAFRICGAAGYAGCVCVELEDASFNGTEEGEKLGLVLGRRFLESC
ncbi:MAG: sugar phosphate isomerase/epimerase [Candidatus Sumerlaeota bacterium]|nr:sugar phosphate isomerase/epimerase [Candidatus Sumerlaeota bacterium]